MSLQFSATTVSGTINRTAGLVGDTDPMTLLACVRLDTDTDAQINLVDIRRYGGAGNTGHHLGTTSTGTSLRGYGNYATNQTATVQELAVGTWTWIALRQTGTTLKASSVDHGGGSVTTQSVTLTAAAGTYDFIPTKLFIGSGDGGQYARATICHVREWSVELTDGEILDEIVSSIPVKSTGLVAASSFAGGSLSVALNGQATGDTADVWTASGDVVYSADTPSFTEVQAVTVSGLVSLSELDPVVALTATSFPADQQVTISGTFTAYTASPVVNVTLSQDGVTIYNMDATLGSGTWSAAFTGVVYGTYQAAATIVDAMGEASTSAVTVTVVVIGGTSETVTITPSTANLVPSGTQQFTAELDGAAGTFVWSVESGAGTVSSAGLYTAAASGSTVAVVRATSQGATDAYAEATVTVRDDNPVEEEDTAVVVFGPLRRNGVALSGFTVDYWIIDSTDSLITSGAATTDSTGYGRVLIGSSYTGQKALVVVNDLGGDMETSGKVHWQQVVTVT